MHAHRLVRRPLRGGVDAVGVARRGAKASRSAISPSASPAEHLTDFGRVAQSEAAYQHRAVLGDDRAQCVPVLGGPAGRVAGASTCRIGGRPGEQVDVDAGTRTASVRSVPVTSSAWRHRPGVRFGRASWDAAGCLVGKDGCRATSLSDGAIQGDGQLHRRQRRAAPVEEVVVAADLVLGDAEHLRPGGGEPLLGRRERAASHVLPSATSSSAASAISAFRSILPLAVSGSASTPVERRRDHVAGQRRAEPLADDVRRRAAVGPE